MTDRHSGYLVVLKRDIREDDSEALLNAIRLIRGVERVQPIESDPMQQIAETRVRVELQKKLWSVLEYSPMQDLE